MRYLVRFDDLCPTMNWAVWDRVERLLDDSGVQPILAVIPQNADPKIQFGPPDPEFWQRARRWDAKGWVIGQHGYRHVYDSRAAGLVPWWTQSEFAGHPREVQRQRIAEGLRRLEDENLRPRIWVSPSHSFDDATLDVLRDLRFEAVSDGFGFRPYRDRRGLVWIPLRPWQAHESVRSTRTLCYHPNTMRDLSGLQRALERHRDRSMGVAFRFDDLLAEAGPRSIEDAASERFYGALFAGRRALKRLSGKRKAS